MENKKNIFTNSLASESVTTRIVNQITDSIIAGDLKPGDKLPTEPDLCDAFKVGRNSVREAIKILEAYGIVYIKRAEGTFINDTYTSKMLDPMLYGILLQKDFASDIIELRKVLDIGVLHSVMQNITPEQLETIHKRLADLEELLSSPSCEVAKLLDADMAFHTAITQATDNQLILSMYSYVERITAPSRKDAMQMIFDTNAKAELIELHRNIVTIIEDKKTSEIEAVLSSHYKFWKQVV